ncbi:MAG: PIN domain-containing protein [Candidatus Saccharimonadales bacterium]
MESINISLFLAIILLAILAEVTYLVVKLPRQNINRKQSRPILVDTSVLIDARIIAVAQSGFIGDTLVIPRSVIGELQFLADNADHEKRTRARHGLDVVKELQSMPEVVVEILQDGSKAEEGVDERLLNLAKKYNAVICTIDFNLNKVATVEGITVLNVNELAKSLRMAYLPGERMLLEVTQKGQDKHQAVGHLTDGTMVVVEHAFKQIGKTVEIEFIRSLQTAAGKMMFARLVELEKPEPKQTPVEVVIAKVERPVKQHIDHSDRQTKKPAGRQQPVVFHSDDRDQKRVERTNRPSRGPKNDTKNQQPRVSHKPKTSAQREAALINLVDSQD